jgi:hypothetical protein
MKKVLLLLFIIASFNIYLHAQKKQVHVTPSTAKIYIDGSEVGNGKYSVKFKRDEDFVILKFEEPGYITKEVKLFKNNPNKSVSYTLFIDEAHQNSVGAGEGIDIANKWFDINSKEGITEDAAWKRLMSVTTKYFDNVEIRDKSAGWIKTAWTVNTFAYQKVRTNLEIKIMMGDDNLKYRARISSEIGDIDTNEQGYEKYQRVLKKYERIIEELQNSLGGNN